MEPDGSKRNASEHQGEDRLLDLVMNFLSPLEESACLSHLRQCADCESLARTLASEHAKFRSRVHASLELENHPAKGTAERAREVTLEDPARTKRRPWWSHLGPAWAIPIAALAVVILFAVRHDGGRTAGSIEQIWLVDPSSFIVNNRAASVPGMDPDLNAGFEAYARRDRDRAIRFLSRSRAEGDLETLRRIYLGSALAWKGRPGEAVRVLQSVPAERIPTALRNESRWTLYASLSHAGRAASAESLLTQLGREPGDVGDRARRRLAGR